VRTFICAMQTLTDAIGWSRPSGATASSSATIEYFTAEKREFFSSSELIIWCVNSRKRAYRPMEPVHVSAWKLTRMNGGSIFLTAAWPCDTCPCWQCGRSQPVMKRRCAPEMSVRIRAVSKCQSEIRVVAPCQSAPSLPPWHVQAASGNIHRCKWRSVLLVANSGL
jgi:hypothetical protein